MLRIYYVQVPVFQECINGNPWSGKIKFVNILFCYILHFEKKIDYR